MADLPDAPLSREEDYLASIAGQNVEVPPCPRSRKEAYLDAIDTKMDGIEEDIEALKNNPDVVDIVDTYADLQAYDKTKLTDNDIIRVLNDETHDGDSTYYRYSTATQTWTYVGSAGSGGPNVVQTTGTSTTDVMSQNATTSMVFSDPETRNMVRIGASASTSGTYGIAIGWRAKTYGNYAVAIGWDANAGMTGTVAIGQGANTSNEWGAIALGAYSGYSVTSGQFMARGQMHIGTSQTAYGYNNSNYRLLSGLYDPQTDHDAATKGYVDTHLGGLSFVALTQAEYDALATKDPNTLYIIKAA